MKAWIVGVLLCLALPLVVHASSVEPVVIGAYSGYQSDIINNKTDIFTRGLASALGRPVRIVTISGEDSLQQLLQKQRYAIVFMPAPWQPPTTDQLTPVVQTILPVGLYARAGPADLSDLKKVSIPLSMGTRELQLELQQRNAAITVASQPIGVDQLRTLIANDNEGVVMSVGLFNNLAPSLRNAFVQRHAFRHRQMIIAWSTPAFTVQQRQQLVAAMLSLSPDALTQLKQTFGLTGFEPYSGK